MDNSLKLISRAGISAVCLAMACGIIACSDDTILDNHAGVREISFRVLQDNGTRAGDNLPDAFRVSSFIRGEDSPIGNIPYIDNRLVKRNGSAEWEMEGNAVFWPNHSLDFVAYAPCGDGKDDVSDLISVSKGDEGDDYDVKLKVMGFETNGKHKDIDLIYALALDQNKDKVDEYVKLTFKHALAQVAFKIATQDSFCDYYEVSGFKISGLGYNGNFSVTVKDGNEEEESWTLLDEGTASEPEDLLASSEKITVGKGDSPVDIATRLYIPQDLGENGDVRLTVTFKPVREGYNMGNLETVTVDMTKEGIKKNWERGGRYVYTLFLSKIPVLFGMEDVTGFVNGGEKDLDLDNEKKESNP